MRSTGPGRRSATVAVGVAAVLSLLAGPSAAAPSRSGAPRGGTVLTLSGGRSQADLRATIRTAIGGASQDLLFDTGSTGISVFASAVPGAVSSLDGDPFQEPFGGGVLLTGVVVATPVRVGGRVSAGPVAIRLVRAATCDPGAPDCAARGGLDAFARSIGADGIFGAGLWSDGSVYSPLAQLAGGAPQSIAVTWRRGTGSVTFDPVLPHRPGATLRMSPGSPPTLPDGSAAWNNLDVTVCWRIDDAARTCTASALDSGAAAVSFPVGFPGGPTADPERLPRGHRVTASASAGAAPFLAFTTGRTAGRNLVTVIPGQPFVDTGIQIFAEFVVVFSLTDGRVLLHRRS